MQKKSELPEGWVWTRLDEISTKITDGEHFRPKTQSHGVYFLSAKDVQEDGVSFNEPLYISEEISQKALKRCNPERGDILIVSRGATVGRMCIVKTDTVFCLLGSVILIKVNENIDSSFLNYILKSPNTHQKIISISGSTAQQAIYLRDIRNIKVPLPPLTEQHRIAQAIEALFARLDATNEKLDSVLGILKKFRESVLAAACDGILTEEWRGRNPDVDDARISVSDYCNRTKSKNKSKSQDYEEEIRSAPDMWAIEYLENFIDIAGRIGWKGLKAEEYRDEGPLLLSAHNLSSSKYVDITSANHLSEERYFESPEIMLKNNDILLVKDGSGIGKIGIVKDLPQEATVNSSLLVIRSPEIIVTDFLYYQLSGPEMQNLVRQRITGSATPHLFQKDIKRFLIKIPPLPEQQEIVRRVDALFAFADSIEAKVEAAREKMEKLKQSILSKAFSGELVETEAEIARRESRGYETAEVLLEKIKESRR